MPEFLSTGLGIFGNICLVLSAATLLIGLHSYNKSNGFWAIVPFFMGLVLLTSSVESLDYQSITGVEFKPLIDISDVHNRGNMTRIPYDIIVKKSTSNRDKPEDFYYTYSADVYLQQSEMIELTKKSSSRNFSILTSNSPETSGCISVRYGNRKVEVVKPNNYYINC